MDDRIQASDIERLLRHIDTTIGQDPAGLAAWPRGWPGEIGTALVDAVFSARARYKTKKQHGIYYQVVAWRGADRPACTSLAALAEEITATGIDAWADEFGNHQRAPSRPADAPGGSTKAAAVLEAARALRALGPRIDRADDINAATSPMVTAALRGVDGIGYATSNYFLMLLGVPGVKPDRMVHRFVQNALRSDTSLSNVRVELLVEETAQRLDVAAHELDHAIWKYESDLAAKISPAS